MLPSVAPLLSTVMFPGKQLVESAIIIGASSGIGAALARDLSSKGYRVGVAARRKQLLEALAKDLPIPALVRQIDISDPETAVAALNDLTIEMGDVGLFIISSGVGFENPDLEWKPEADTIAVNVSGFACIVGFAARYLERRGRGQLVGISSVVAIRGHGGAPAYGASKAFESSYLRSMRHRFNTKNLPVYVTEVLPGFVDTAMAKGSGLFWVAPVEVASRQIIDAIERRKKKVYVTKRWIIVAFILWIIPDWLYKKR